MTQPDPTATPLAKVDPEKLELRARPRPAVRFRKGLIVGLAGAIAGIIALVSWIALEPPSFRLEPPTSGNELKQNSGDALEDAPKSYDQVPILGPPLPGDLGTPILRHRAATGENGSASLELERLRAEEARAASVRSSPLMVSLERQGDRDESRQRMLERPDAKPITAAVPGDKPPAPLTLSAGTIIPASLITGLNSDLPGIVLAQVTEPVRDTAAGRVVLIPQGSRLIGEYDSKIAYGQRRAMLSWNRIVLPDGRSLALDKLPAADRAGYSGLEDEVDFHGWQLLKGIALSTLLGVGTELSLGDSDDALVRALSDSAEQSTARAGDEITKRNLDVKPTLRVRPGWPIRVILHQDLALEPWEG